MKILTQTKIFYGINFKSSIDLKFRSISSKLSVCGLKATENKTNNNQVFVYDENIFANKKRTFSMKFNNEISIKQLERSYTNGKVAANKSSSEYKKINYGELKRLILQYVWPKDNPGIKIRVIGSVSLIFLGKIVNLQVPLLFKEAINELSANPETALATGTSLILFYGLAKVCVSFCNQSTDMLFTTVSRRSIRNLSKSIFKHLHDLDMNFHVCRKTGEVSRALNRGAKGFNYTMKAIVHHIFPTMLEISMVTGLLWYSCGGQFAGITIATITTYMTWTVLLTKIKSYYHGKMNKADGKMGNIAMDSLINYEAVKYFNNERFEVRKYDKVLAQFEDAGLKTNHLRAINTFVEQATFTVGMTAMMFLSAQKIAQGEMTVGDLVYVNGLLAQLSVPMRFASFVYRDVQEAIIDMEALFFLKNKQSDIKVIPNAHKLKIDEKGDSSVCFNNVQFKYEKGKEVLKNINLHINSGESVGIVGGSGSGKSTLIKLLFRYYDCLKGYIKVGGHDLKAVNLESLRQTIGIVPQDTVLFNDTLYHNIAYGDLSATKDKVEKAAKMADLHECIMNMPQQYNTLVGERGLKLSGGEKQRIAIARAILKNPKILVYDEATSALDSVTEENILGAIKRISKERTSIFIAHRLSTVMDCDQIFVLEKGQVKEHGKHEQLLANENSMYAHLWRCQNKNNLS